jgi:hypothetical protein
MSPDRLAREFLAEGADGAAVQAYLAELARNDVLATRGDVQREIARMQAELAQLERDKAALQDEMTRLRLVLAEHLLAFLPIIYRHFWTVVSPDEFALLCGRQDAPRIVSPHMEPGIDTVRFMKARFAALAATEREQVLALCRALPHRLQVRAEMREFFPPGEPA